MGDKLQQLIEAADNVIEETDKLGEYHEVPNDLVHAIDALHGALSDYTNGGSQNPWQPIESIPKDGTEVIAMRSNGWITRAVWYNNPFGRTDTVIENASGKWWSVTHWMHLPPNPK